MNDSGTNLEVQVNGIVIILNNTNQINTLNSKVITFRENFNFGQRQFRWSHSDHRLNNELQEQLKNQISPPCFTNDMNQAHDQTTIL
jgi:hypothetical protein